MIVTLKGADFSQSNIGNRQKWNINYSLGYGISTPTITSVKKETLLT